MQMLSSFASVFRADLCRYIVVGILGTFVYYLVLWLLVEVAGIPVLIAISATFLLVVLEYYVLHYFFTYLSSAHHMDALPKFVMLSLVGFWLNLGIMFPGVEHLESGYLWVQAVAIALVVAGNLVISIRWIFFRNN
jgi:putative flippase GtrA